MNLFLPLRNGAFLRGRDLLVRTHNKGEAQAVMVTPSFFIPAPSHLTPRSFSNTPRSI